jgi:hypothetical protein
MASGKSQDTLRIPNLKQIQDTLKGLGASNKELGQASFEAGIITARSTQAFMQPYKRSGKLLSTVKAQKLGTKVVVKMGNNTTAQYAGPQNFGWRKRNIKGRMFFQQAIRATRQRVLDTYLDELQKLVNKYERKANK